MRIYYLTCADLGIGTLPDSTILPSGVDVVSAPGDADLFWCPASLFGLSRFPGAVERGAVAHGAPERTVFADISDLDATYALPSLMIRANARDWMLATAPRTAGWPWPVDNLSAMTGPPPGGFTWDVCFVGWTSRRETDEALASCAASGLSCRFIPRRTFWGYVERDDPPEAARQRQEYLEALRFSRLSLCPQSIPGVWRYRWWEAWSACRVPIHFGDGMVWPTTLGAEALALSAPLVHARSACSQAGDVCRAFLASHDDQALIALGAQLRAEWERSLDRRKWGALARETAERHLAKIMEG